MTLTPRLMDDELRAIKYFPEDSAFNLRPGPAPLIFAIRQSTLSLYIHLGNFKIWAELTCRVDLFIG